MSAPPQMPPAPKKGLHPLAWVGIGCGGLLVIAIIASVFIFTALKRKYEEVVKELSENPEKVVAEKIVEANPDLEMLDQDEEAGEVTIRNSSTGEETTISYGDLAQGKLTVKGEDGSVTQLGSADISSLPSWVPAYPSMTDPVLPYHQESDGGTNGLLSYTTQDLPDDIIAFYEGKMSSSSQSSSSMTVGDAEKKSKTFRDGKTTLTISTQRVAGNPTQVQVSYAKQP